MFENLFFTVMKTRAFYRVSSAQAGLVAKLVIYGNLTNGLASGEHPKVSSIDETGQERNQGLPKTITLLSEQNKLSKILL